MAEAIRKVCDAVGGMVKELERENKDGDLISRAAAIDEIKALYEWHEIVTEDRAIDHFKRLPSADAVEVVRCGECKHMLSSGGCSIFADSDIRPSASDFCSCGERE